MKDRGAHPAGKKDIVETQDTSWHIQRALDGDEDGWAWLVAHLSPFLHLQATYRLRGPLQRLYDPEDLVNEVWAVTFRRSQDLRRRQGHWTPVLMRFLSRVLLLTVNDLVKKHITRDGRERDLARRLDGAERSLDRLAADTTSVLGRVDRNELRRTTQKFLTHLNARDQEVLVLCGIEGLPVRTVADRLGEKRTAIGMRYRRALQKLLGVLPAPLVSELFEFDPTAPPPPDRTP